MNSLTYLSRQFDVLASRTAPSTPTGEFPPLGPESASSSRSGSSRRYSASSNCAPTAPPTWSLKSLVAPPPPPRPRRSMTSPARILTPNRSRSKSQARRTAIRLKVSPQPQSVLRRVFVVRVFVLLWHTICAAARSVIAWQSPFAAGDIGIGAGTALADGGGDTEKEAEAEDDAEIEDVEKRLMLPTPPPSSPPSPIPDSTPPSIIRSQTDPETAPLVLASHAHPPQTFVFAPPPPPPPQDGQLLPHPLVSSLLPTSAFSLSLAFSRTPTPDRISPPPGLPLPPRKTPFHLPKTLVLDLDETLIHSTSRPLHPSSGGSGLLGGLGLGLGKTQSAGHMVEVVLGGRSTLYHVYKRPFVDFFLRKVSSWYTLVIFTASMQEYADPVIDWLDAGRGILGRRFFRESCTQLPNGSYTKDLSVIEPDLARVCLIDNSPVSYNVNEMNGIPIEGWTNDPSDQALLDLLPVLDSLRFTSDVRHVLGIRGYS